ncbi:MAG: PqqD family protein [Armatimonadota bacterium]
MSRLQNIVSQYVPFVRKKSTHTREDVLRSKPTRNPVLEWERTSDVEIKLRIPQRNDYIGRMLCKVFHAPSHKEILLDEVGSDVWEICDGTNNFEAIVNAMCKKHKITRRECEVSVGMYLKMLGERKLLGFQLGGRKKK